MIRCPIAGTAAVRRSRREILSGDKVVDVAYDIAWERADPEIHVATELLDDPEARAVIVERYALDEWCPHNSLARHARLRRASEYDPAELARATRWTREDWQRAHDEITMADLPWESTARWLLETRLGPRWAPALISAHNAYTPPGESP
jgi:hypothetical protein